MVGKVLRAVVIGVVCMPVLAFAKTASPMPAGKHDSKTPIDITSDTLDVLQEKNQAVFTGHVVAIQGEMRLKADKMTVYYSKPAADKTADKSKKAKSAKDSPNNAIKKIDVDGNVFLSAPEETASGLTGNYDVEHQQIYLNNNVVLTKGKNVLKGEHLVYDLNTGKSKLIGGDNGAVDKNGRVHALFVPEDKKAGDKKSEDKK